MVTLNELESAQIPGVNMAKKTARKLMDYCATHENAKIRYCAYQMILHVYIDAFYTSASMTHSMVGRELLH